MKLIQLIFIVMIISAFGCSTSENNSHSDQLSTSEYTQGKELLDNKCFACHSPKSTMDGRMAPPMIEIKNHYKSNYKNREEFITGFINFSSSPSNENAIMDNAIKKFGVMPNMSFDKTELNLIAQYIYDKEIEEPKWFAKYNEGLKNKTSKNKELSPKEKGQKMALATKKILGKNLMGQLNNSGSSAALSFCNEKAYVLTDSMSIELGASIKRVSDKPRNPNNKANKEELAYINKLHQTLKNGEELQSSIQTKGKKSIGYYPITTNNMCIQCHGNPTTDINKETREKITSLYPDDKAINYGENELRGIWVVEMGE